MYTASRMQHVLDAVERVKKDMLASQQLAKDAQRRELKVALDRTSKVALLVCIWIRVLCVCVWCMRGREETFGRWLSRILICSICMFMLCLYDVRVHSCIQVFMYMLGMNKCIKAGTEGVQRVYTRTKSLYLQVECANQGVEGGAGTCTHPDDGSCALTDNESNMCNPTTWLCTQRPPD